LDAGTTSLELARELALREDLMIVTNDFMVCAYPHRGAAAAPLPRTWLLIACFGIINSGYGIVVAWLAPAYMAAGWSAQQGGELVAWLALAQTASGLGLPLLAAGRLDRRPWMALAIAM
ncbi:hypothetical protein ACSZM6_12615, partial [Aeromonas caviae]